MKINWKVRLKSKPFLVSLVSLVVLFIQQVAEALGFDLSPTIEAFKLPAVTLLSILVLLGIVVDATTDGVSDSERVMNKDKLP